MPRVTKLSPQKNKKYVNVYLDGKYEFGIDLENLYKFGIKVEREFTDEEIDEIKQAANSNKTLNKLLNFATIRPRSYKEITDWFYRQKVTESIWEELINKLEKLQLLDDEKFASWWINQRLEFKPRAKQALKYELRGKGISSKVIDKAIADANIDEFKLANRLAQKKLRLLSRYDEETKQKKLVNFLKSKGFNWGIIKEILEEM